MALLLSTLRGTYFEISKAQFYIFKQELKMCNKMVYMEIEKVELIV